jgi:hypothetical protein
MSLSDIPEAMGGWHDHSFDIDFVKEMGRNRDSGKDVDLGGLMQLTLMASVNKPVDVMFRGRPPESV